MSLEPEPLRLERNSRAVTAGGGRKAVMNLVANVSGYVNFYRKKSEQLLEQAEHNAQGGGRETLTEQFVTFEPPFPDVREADAVEETEDWLVRADGTRMRVLFVRPYDDEWQVDVETL